MLNDNKKIKKTVSFCSLSPLPKKLEINKTNNNSRKIILKRIKYNNKNNHNLKINKEFKSISIINSLSKLNKNSPENLPKRNELNIINNSTINHEFSDKAILIDNKDLFKKKSLFNPKKALSQTYNFSKTVYNKFNNSNINIEKSINFIDSKILDDSKSKVENINVNEENKNKDIFNKNEEPFHNFSKSQKILLPKLFNSSKKSFRKKHISYIIKSKHKNISATDIYLHYLKENENDKSKIDNQPTIKDFSKYLKNNDNKKFNYGFDKIYGNDQSFIKRINEIKKNKNIALKNDFHIQDYQKTLIKLLKKRISDKSLENLDKSYKLFNERNYGMIIPRGRYISLADKLKDFLSKDIFEKVKRLDRNYIIFLEKKEELKHRNSIEFKTKNNFYKELNKTIYSFNRKRKFNRSI